MSTTLSTTFTRDNYCSLPTTDVEIITDKTVHCEHCAGEIIYDPAKGVFGGYKHRKDPAEDHRASPIPRCHYCGGEGTVTHHQHAWHDSADCSRCGGSYGFAIGD